MKKKEEKLNLHIYISKQVLELKIKLLAHHSDDKDFGLKEAERLNAELQPLINKEKSMRMRTLCCDTLNYFDAWCLDHRRKILNKHYPQENSDDKQVSSN